MAKDLLFEIGTEELPAKVIPRALGALEGFLKKNLASKRLGFSSIRTLGTPRRLVLIVEGLEEKQPDARLEVKGPQKKAAFDDSGKPTGALLGFARSQGVDVNDIKTVKTDKGEYAYALKDIKGDDTLKVLPETLLDTISQEFMPKSMRWGSYGISFSRPIHWIVALYGNDIVPFTYGHIGSSDVTFGHRFLSPKQDGRPAPLKVDSIASYLSKLSSGFVIPDPEERKRIIKEGLEKAALEVKGSILPDEGLLEEVAYLVEYPVVVRGSFEHEFLILPRDVIVNAMREHQRYFSIVNANGELLPYFVTIANTKANDLDIVRKGNERVLRARLNDAKFHFEQDMKKKLADRADALKGVVFQVKLGTSYEKVERFTSLALYAGAKTGFSRPLDEGEQPSDFLTESLNPSAYDTKSVDPGLYSKYVVGRAAMLSKADLTTGMVGEFPNLQGAIGCVYAKKNGEAPEVCAAIYEHYLPTVSGGALPVSMPGAIVSIADKIDTITGCFSVGLIPTGAQDPYALRRQALGVIAIILDKGLRLSIDELVDEAIRLIGKKAARDKKEIRSDILEFLKERLKNQLLSQGLSFDAIDAVLSAPWFDIVDAVKRVKALEGFKSHPECGSLVIAFKRVSNILKGLEPGGRLPDAGLFQEVQEKELYDASSGIAPVIESYWKQGEYEKVFEALASIKDKIDAFFDKVMVMVEDESIKGNRLVLLNSVRDLYFRIADLSKLVA